MAIDIDVDVKFDKEAILNASDRMIHLALETIGSMAEGYAKKDCPVGSPESTGIPWYIGGNLRNSITHEVHDDEKEVVIGTNVRYAPYVEFGDSYRHIVGKAHFLRDSLADHTDQYENILEQFLHNG